MVKPRIASIYSIRFFSVIMLIYYMQDMCFVLIVNKCNYVGVRNSFIMIALDGVAGSACDIRGGSDSYSAIIVC